MSSPGSKRPLNWSDYEFGRSPSQGSPGSTSRSIYRQISQQDREDGTEAALRRRRSSLSLRINSFRQAGGVNSIDNFARSWQRAAGFHEITSVRRPSFILTDSSEEDGDYRRRDEEYGPHQRSLLRQQLESAGTSPEAVIEEEVAPEDVSHMRERGGDGSDIFSAAPHETSPLLGRSYGTSFGTLPPHINEDTRRRASKLYEEQQLTGAQPPDKEREPLLVKQVQREDGTKTNIVIGQSTLPQTIFNSVNTLVGVGLLSLPLAIKYAGWIVGMGFLIFSAVVTSYTAKLLAICLDVDPSLVTYADVAYVSFGPRARVVTSILFSLELIAACVALVILFADSLNALIPGWGILQWKILSAIILMPLNFVPLRLLSISSILGILCCIGLVLIVFIDGFIKPHRPGSLRDPATTYLFPANWSTLPLSFGLLMSPWGGHSVFPNIYRDMRHRHKYGRALRSTYIFTYLLDLSMSVGGYLMFGEWIRDEVTSNILLTEGYPRVLSVLTVVFIAIVPLTKIPLSCRPITSTIEILCGLDPRAVSPSPSLQGMSSLSRGAFKFAIRIFVILFILVISVVLPSFDSVMALMGSALCFTICVILPVAFYLKIFGKDISLRERILDWILIISCSVMAVVGTVWAFLPKDKIGAE